VENKELKKVKEPKGEKKMTSEMLKKIIKKELGWKLVNQDGILVAKNTLCAREYDDGFYLSISIIQDKVDKTVNIHLYKGRITTERQVKAFIKKYKNIKRALR
jgi:hypothetical protein